MGKTRRRREIVAFLHTAIMSRCHDHSSRTLCPSVMNFQESNEYTSLMHKFPRTVRFLTIVTNSHSMRILNLRFCDRSLIGIT